MLLHKVESFEFVRVVCGERESKMMTMRDDRSSHTKESPFSGVFFTQLVCLGRVCTAVSLFSIGSRSSSVDVALPFLLGAFLSLSYLRNRISSPPTTLVVAALDIFGIQTKYHAHIINE